jgi:hypothetical protein
MSDTSDAQLDALLAKLGRDRAPPQDLWSGIEAQIAVQDKRRQRPWRLAAGIAAATLSATIAFYVWERRAQQPDTAETPEDAAYLSARADLEPSYRAQLQQLAPDTRMQVERDLDVIRKARADIRHALASDPGSPLLNELMTTTWQQQIDLYRDVAANPTGSKL